jgi:predicted nucleotide-binding protein
MSYYYHSFLTYYVDGKLTSLLWFNRNKAEMQHVINCIEQSKDFFFCGRIIKVSDLTGITSYASEFFIPADFCLPNNKKISQSSNNEIMKFFSDGEIKGIFESDVFPRELSMKNESKIRPVPKNKIFIVHGRDKASALELKDYLKDTLKLDAVIFDDVKLKRTSSTIIEILEDIMANAGYAFIVATPDDLGCLCKTVDDYKKSLIGKRITHRELTDVLSMFNHRARQNVVFEHGLFTGALGRDKVCCLLHTDLAKDKPTDIDGILYEPFKDSIKETFPQITEKLKDPNVGLIKN